jgi:flagellar basal-body rod protein FlgF
MDKLVYVAMTGAKHLMLRQDNVAHNLANVNTPGFRAELSAFRSAPALGDGQPTRVFAVDSTTGYDFTPGPVQQTGRPLDVAIQGAGWLAVEGADGREAYTRLGSLEVGSDGALKTSNGYAVLSEQGPVSIPADHALSIANDGTLSAFLPGQTPVSPITVGKLKLVNPPAADMERGNDGLFRVRGGAVADADPNVALASGALEGSNVNAVEAMVSMISLARQFDLQMKMLQNADSNARAASQLLSAAS